jgi:hypothetical protein
LKYLVSHIASFESDEDIQTTVVVPEGAAIGVNVYFPKPERLQQTTGKLIGFVKNHTGLSSLRTSCRFFCPVEQDNDAV